MRQKVNKNQLLTNNLKVVYNDHEYDVKDNEENENDADESSKWPFNTHTRAHTYACIKHTDT